MINKFVFSFKKEIQEIKKDFLSNLKINSLNIVFFAQRGFNPKNGGIERVSDVLAKGFSEAGHHVEYVTWHSEDECGEFIPPFNQLILPDQEQVCGSDNIKAFANLVISANVDVIICQYALEREETVLPYLVKKKTGVKLIYVYHSSPNFEALSLENLPRPILSREKRWHRQFKRITRIVFKKQKQAARNKRVGALFSELYAMGDALVVLSEKYIPVVQQLSGINSTEKLYAIGNPNTYHTSEVIIGKKENTVLFVGRLYSEKRPEKAMQLWQRVQYKFPDWNMKMLGVGSLKKDLRELHQVLNLERFFLEGSQNPQSYYAKAKIFIMLSDYEGFPMALTEAMHYGVVPVVFNTFQALPEIIEDNVTGVSVTPFDLDEFEEKLTVLMCNDEKRAKMAEKARVSVERFALPNIIKKWEEIFEKIM